MKNMLILLGLRKFSKYDIMNCFFLSLAILVPFYSQSQEQQTLCSLNYIPDGWVITDVIKNCQANACKGKSSTCWIITNITRLPNGSVLNICPLNNTPPGWKVLQTNYCDCCGATRPGAGVQWRIQRVSGGPQQAAPASAPPSAPVQGSVIPTKLPKTPSVVPGGNGTFEDRMKTFEDIDVNTLNCANGNKAIRANLAEGCRMGHPEYCKAVSQCYSWCANQVTNVIDKQIYYTASSLFKDMERVLTKKNSARLSNDKKAEVDADTEIEKVFVEMEAKIDHSKL